MRILLFIIFGFSFLFPSLQAANQWPTWRGPNADGTVTDCQPPTKWSATENIKWKIKLTGKPNFVFPEQRLAVFVDGCFWHACPRCYIKPKQNAKF